MIRYEIDRALFGVADARRHLIETDPQARVALTMFGEAQRLSELSKAPAKAPHHPGKDGGDDSDHGGG